MTKGPTWFSRAGLRSGPPVLRLADELVEVRKYKGYPFWERLQLWIERYTPLRPTITQSMRRWSMLIHPMKGRPVDVTLDEEGNIRLAEVGYNYRQTILKVELDTPRGRHIFVDQILLLAQLPLKVNATRRKVRSNATRDRGPSPDAGSDVFAGPHDRGADTGAQAGGVHGA